MTAILALAVAIGAGLAAGPAKAEKGPGQPAEAVSEGEAWLIQRIHPRAEQQVGEIRQQLEQAFAQSTYVGGGIGKRDYEIADSMQKAQQAAHIVGQLLAFDHDGDGRITRDELERAHRRAAMQPLRSGAIMVRPTAEQVRDVLEKLVRGSLAADLDGDGNIALDEARAHAWRQVEGKRRQMGAGARTSAQHALVPLSLDTSGDGIVSEAEYETAVARVLGWLDADGNGTVSAAEAAAWATRRRAAEQAIRDAHQLRQQAEKAERCGLPRVPAGTRFIAVGTYEARTLSNLAIGGDDVALGVGLIEIEPGDEPLTVLAVSHRAMIWQLRGAVDRVAGLIVANNDGSKDKTVAAGVVGIAAGKIAFARASDCIQAFSNAGTASGVRAVAEVAAVLGRRPDDVIAVSKVGRVALPSGIVAPDANLPVTRLLPKSGPGAPMWLEALRFTPGGIADLAAKDVVASAPVTPYAVLPYAAGIAQLLDEGALEVAGMSRVRRVGNLTIVGEASVVGTQPSEDAMRPTEFRIMRKMRFPAGLYGGHSASFILGRGVPMPDGDPGHSRVVDEATGKVLRGH